MLARPPYFTGRVVPEGARGFKADKRGGCWGLSVYSVTESIGRAEAWCVCHQSAAFNSNHSRLATAKLEFEFDMKRRNAAILHLCIGTISFVS